MSSAALISIELVDAFGVGVYLLFAFIHLDHWRRRPQRRTHLWVALAAGGALVVDLTGMLLRDRGEQPGILGALNMTAVAATTACLVELVAALGRKPVGRLTRWIQAGAVLLAVPAGLTGGAVAPAVLVACFLLLTIAMVRAVAAGRSGDAESRTLAAGLLVLLATLIADVLMELRVVPALSGLPVLGFTVLFLTAARALNDRSEREYRELVALRAELELRVRERTQDLEEANRMLAEMSRTDALTGLPNRRGFLEAAAQEIARAARSGEPWSIVMADLDHFKEVNDRLGHAAGDTVLREASAVLRGALRAQDLAGRWGGEEFILLLPQTAAAGAVRAAETVRQAIAAHGHADGGSMTISLGVAGHREGESLDGTIAAADRALYRAKQEGRDRVAAEG